MPNKNIFGGSDRDYSVADSSWQPSRSVDTDWKYQGRDPEGNIQATWRTNLSGPEGTGGIAFEDFDRRHEFWDKHGYLTGSPRQRTEFKTGPMSSQFFNEMYPTYDDQIMRGQRARDYQNRLGTEWSDPPLSGWKSKSPVTYEPHRGTQWPSEGEFGGLGSLSNRSNDTMYAGLLGPGRGLGDPFSDKGGMFDNLGRWFSGEDPYDPENDDALPPMYFNPDTGEMEILESGELDTGDWINEIQTAELGLPAEMDWQINPYEKLTMDELINLGATEDQIAAYLGLA